MLGSWKNIAEDSLERESKELAVLQGNEVKDETWTSRTPGQMCGEKWSTS